MEDLKIQKQNAIEAYKKATLSCKTTLEVLFGKEIFEKKITDRVKTFEDACEICPPTKQQQKALDYGDESMVATVKIEIIAKALNEGVVLDASDTSQYKYYPYHKVSGSGFACSAYYYWNTNATTPARLCYKNADLAIYAGKQFIDIYNDYLK